MSEPIRLNPGDPTPEEPYVDDDWFRFYGPDPENDGGATHMEVHEDCDQARCAYRDEPCPWHPEGCTCSLGQCQTVQVRRCGCGSGKPREALNDARGIFVRYVCDACVESVKSEYRQDIFEDSNYWSDEPIDEEL